MPKPDAPIDVGELADHHAEILNLARDSHEPLVITVEGKPTAIIQNIDDYDALLVEINRLRALEGIRLGLEAVERGATQPADMVFEELESKYPFLRS